MDVPILVDSSVYIRLMRQRLDPVAVLFEHYDTVNLVTCGMVRLEVLRAIRNPLVHSTLSKLFGTMHFVVSDERLWHSATKIACQTTALGRPISESCAIKAASALRLGASVLTLDSDFQRVPDLHVLSLPPHLDV